MRVWDYNPGYLFLAGFFCIFFNFVKLGSTVNDLLLTHIHAMVSEPNMYRISRWAVTLEVGFLISASSLTMSIFRYDSHIPNKRSLYAHMVFQITTWPSRIGAVLIQFHWHDRKEMLRSNTCNLTSLPNCCIAWSAPTCVYSECGKLTCKSNL